MRRSLIATFVALATVVALLAVSGCGGSETAVPTLDGTAWRLTEWTLSSLDPNDFTITATFADGKISGMSAVNSYAGGHTEGPGDAFSVDELAGTMMAGPEADMRAEAAYLELLSQTKSYKLVADYFALIDADEEIPGTEITPRVRSLIGALKGATVTEADYRRHLEEKFQ